MELIVVLVILAILAAMLVPALTGYIDLANEKKVIAEAHDMLVAVQTTIAETYGLHSEEFDAPNKSNKISFSKSYTRSDGTKVTVACLTNFMLWNAQNGINKIDSDPGTWAFAKRMLVLLDSDKLKTARYCFANNNTSSDFVNCAEANSTYYQTTKSKNPCISIVIGSDWHLEFIEYARMGILVRIDMIADTITTSRTNAFTKISYN